jgi:hypothetical protein
MNPQLTRPQPVPSIAALLEQSIDYAGLFPPAGLDMPSSVSNFAAYLRGENSAMLGRFIVPLTRLAEFEKAAAEFRGSGRRWRIGVLSSANLDMATIESFCKRAGDWAVIDTVEFKPERPDDVPSILGRLPAGLTSYVELALTDFQRPHAESLLANLARAGCRVKIRTGGLDASMFPASALIARFLTLAHAAKVAFKASAGLHHPIRAAHNFTYAADSPHGIMHGFLNVFLAAALIHSGGTEEQALAILEEQYPAAFEFTHDGVMLRLPACNTMLTTEQLRNARQQFVMSFGSCSFDEPLEDLKGLGLL